MLCKPICQFLGNRNTRNDRFEQVNREMERIHGHEQSPTRLYIQKHFANPTFNHPSDKNSKGKEKLYTIRENIYEGIIISCDIVFQDRSIFKMAPNLINNTQNIIFR